MKAIRIHNYGRTGGSSSTKDAPRPEPQAGEVLVRVHAAGVNSIDWKVREGHMKDFWPHKFPLIFGWGLVRSSRGTRLKACCDSKSATRFTACLIQPATARTLIISSFANQTRAQTALASSHPRGGSAFGGADSVAIVVRDRAIAARSACVDSRRQRRSRSFRRATRRSGKARTFSRRPLLKIRTLLRELGVDEPIDYTQQRFEKRRTQHRHRARHAWRRNAGTLLVSFEKGRRFLVSLGPAAVGGESQKTRRTGRAPRRATERRAARRDREDHRLGQTRADNRSHSSAERSAACARA